MWGFCFWLCTRCLRPSSSSSVASSSPHNSTHTTQLISHNISTHKLTHTPQLTHNSSLTTLTLTQLISQLNSTLTSLTTSHPTLTHNSSLTTVTLTQHILTQHIPTLLPQLTNSHNSTHLRLSQHLTHLPHTSHLTHLLYSHNTQLTTHFA